MTIGLIRSISHIMYCTRCQLGIEDKAAFIYNGDSLCEKHYNEIRKWECRYNINTTIGYQP